MISVVIPTGTTPRLLVPTLAGLVPGAAAGLVREVLLVDSGANPDVAEIADAAGCECLTGPQDPAARMRTGADAARSQWLLFLEPGGLLQEGWTRDVSSFIEQVERRDAAGRQAATFRLALDGFGIGPRLKEAVAMAWQALTGRPRPQQGLLIHRRLYEALGGPEAGHNAPTGRLMSRLGRSRLILLRAQILLPED